MERYRVGLILALPGFDTYKCMEAYARHPDSLSCRVAFLRLMDRAEARLLFDASASGGGVAAMESRFGMLTGVARSEFEQLQRSTMPDLGSMSQEELVSLYSSMCKQAGIPVDLEDSLNENKPGD